MALTGDVLELLARVGGVVPADQAAWDPGDPAELIYRCSRDLGRDGQRAFLEAFDTDWTLLLVASCWHPCLAEITSWAEHREATLFLASPSGPPPPAVAVYSRPAP